MGEMADWILEEGDWSFCNDEPIIPNGYWMQRNGHLIKISKMTDNHLENAIKLFTKNKRKDEVWELIEEQDKRKKEKLENKRGKHPLYQAFKAGWKSGYKSCSQKAWPEVGPSSLLTFEEAWKEFTKTE